MLKVAVVLADTGTHEGLGRMGGNMARRLRRVGVPLAAYVRDGRIAQDLARESGLAAAGAGRSRKRT